MAEIGSIRKEMKKYRYVYPVVFLIFALGVFLRVYNFSADLIFKSDQARDALIINQVNLNGLSSLPLMGPQIGGMESRMGPIFYYFQVISGKIFGFSPESLAYPDLLFGILAMTMLFLLARKFFNLSISLWLTALSSVSLLLVTFSRFAWNPNSLTFFTALFAYSFLTVLDQSGSQRKLFLALAFICLGIIAQLHLFAILSLGLGLFLFLLITKSLSWKEIIGGFLIVLFLHTPLLISEFKTGAKNMNFFSMTVSEKGEKESRHFIYENFFRAYQENSRALWITATGWQNSDIISTRGIELRCNQSCKDGLPYSLLAMILFGYATSSIFYNWKKEKNLSQKKKLTFLGLWWISFLFFSVSIAYQMEIRFYLGVTPLFFISLGFILRDVLSVSKNKWFKYFIFSGCFMVIVFNLQETLKYLKELSVSRVSNQESGDDLRFGSDDKVTLGQLRDIAEETSLRLDKENFLVISGETHYVKAIYYLLSVEYGYRGCYLKGRVNNIGSSLDQLVIGYNKSDDSKKYLLDDSDGKKEFGTLGASFKKATNYDKEVLPPAECINY